MTKEKSSRPTLFIIGSMRSGKTLMKDLIMKACPNAINLTDDDCECRTFWQYYGLRIGARATGTYCLAASKEDVRDEHRISIQEHIVKRCINNRMVINDSAHLMNKIGYVAEVLPESRFVHVIRDTMGMVSVTKKGFEHGNTNGESYPPYVHYWPDCEFPCWYTLRNDRKRCWPTIGAMRRKAREVCYCMGIKKRKLARSPSLVIAHERLSVFLEDHPDLTRYYPGDGFLRLPEAWLSQNYNIGLQLDLVEDHRWMGITYRDIVCDTRKTLAKVMEFAGCRDVQMNLIPAQLDKAYLHQWKTDLTDSEKKGVQSIIQSRSHDFNVICESFGEDLLQNS